LASIIQGQSGHDFRNFIPKGGVLGSVDPYDFGLLKANRSKAVKATDVKFACSQG